MPARSAAANGVRMGRDDVRVSKWIREAHPIFWPTVACGLIGLFAALSAADRRPGYALNDAFVYRIEVGLAVFVTLYAVTLALWLSYQGRSVRLEVPGGPAIDAADPGLDSAAEGFDEFRREVGIRLDAHDDNFDLLVERLSTLEEPHEPGAARLDEG